MILDGETVALQPGDCGDWEMLDKDQNVSQKEQIQEFYSKSR